MMLMMAALAICMISQTALIVLIWRILGPQASIAKHIAAQQKAEADYRKAAAVNRAEDEEELKRKKKQYAEEQKAFDQLLNYSAYDAYGMEKPVSGKTAPKE